MSQSPPLADTLAAASRVVARVLAGESLNTGLDRSDAVPPAIRAAIQNLCYGTLRDFGAPDLILKALARRSLPERRVRALLLCALHELRHERRAPYTVVDEAVTACAQIGHAAARGFVNASLRNFLRRREAFEADATQNAVGRFGYPQWWIARIEHAYPTMWQELLVAGNVHAPMALRVNCRKLDAEMYVAKLADRGIPASRRGRCGVMLGCPRGVDDLPGFAEGEASVQDLGAQLAAPLLDLRDGLRVLDACAAPGGKTGHILELVDVDLLALDHDAARASRIEANLERLDLRASVRVGDAGDLAEWWDGRPFDRILLDSPCSASGVVRRHPDAKWLRRESDLAGFAREQSRLLDALWQTLAPDGKLLYATCSVFPEENSVVVQSFAARQGDARRLSLPELGDGQLLPTHEHDGFFYALLEKI